MADGSAEPAFLGLLREAENNDTGGDVATKEEDAQIDSSDEYDPSAQSFQDVSYAAPESRSASLDAYVRAQISTVPTAASSTPVDPIPKPRPASSAAAPLTSALQAKSESGNMLASISATPKNRLPHDTIGILEDRIAEDEKGDLPAWIELIDEHKKRGKLEEVRKVYERFFEVFPTAADEKVAQIQLESGAGNKQAVEAIFFKSLNKIPNLNLWSAYLSHVRRYHNITLDKSGKASQITHAAYEAVLNAVGMDRDSGGLWLDYIAFIKSGPGVIGGSTWQDGQKMDVLRRAYQQAIVTPHQAVEQVWREYSTFEMSINKQTGRKFLGDKSPEYMTARTAFSELQNMTRGLNRTTLPRLPPVPGYDGYEEYMQQVDIWTRWLEWEKKDPLVIKDEDAAKWKKRVVYVYKQALMALRFWPEMWLNAAEFCFDNELESEGNDFLTDGFNANPESALLAFRQADRLELSTTNGNDDNSKAERALKVREPYNKCFNALYPLVDKVQESEARQLAAVEADPAANTNGATHDEAIDDSTDYPQVQTQKEQRIAAIKMFHKAQKDQLCKTITHVWIAMMRAFQRMQGKGRPNALIGGSRSVFGDARKRGRLTSDLFLVAALLEYHTGETDLAQKIFERGQKLFPNDALFALEYIKFLTLINDTMNARVVFETTVSKLHNDEDPQVRAKAKPLFVYFHKFESQYGELTQVMKLEARMREAFKDDPKLASFSSRFNFDDEGTNAFNPTSVHPVISPATQLKPASQPLIREPSVQSHTIGIGSPQVTNLTQPATINSPKRPLPADLAELTQDRASKIPRSDSPLKGAAGRRLNAQVHSGGTPLMGSTATLPQLGGPPVPPAPVPLPRDLTFLLSIIPPASTYRSTKFKPEAMVKLVQEMHIPGSVEEMRSLQASRQMQGYGNPAQANYWARQ